MPVKKPASVDSFQQVLLEIVGTTGWRLTTLAARFNVSTKTIGRYYNGRSVPPAGRRHGVVHALSDVRPDLLRRVIDTLGLTSDFPHGMPRAPVAPAVARTTVESALAEVVERLDTGAQKSRLALSRFVSRLDDAGIDLATARALLANANANASQ